MKSWPELLFRKSLAPQLGVPFLLLFLALVSPISGLSCYQCGQYTDGPGSITPCINYTDALHLKECPQEASKQCIKYVNEASTVRDCADECNEKRSDSWGTSIYCCSEDACNSATVYRPPSIVGTWAAAAAAVAALTWSRLGRSPPSCL